MRANDDHSNTSSEEMELTEGTVNLEELTLNIPPIPLLQLSFTIPDLSNQLSRQFQSACHFFTHSNRPLQRAIPRTSHIDPKSGDAYLAVTLFRQTERARELEELFLLQDILRNRKTPNAALILILSYLNTDPELERSYDALEARPYSSRP
ncbi:MAG: hypothetical protein Q8R83_02515 [Legionellaceae bacterium]|nr:hypothetical protein [Legionellaceae bacterium]